jgi:hypothetical protein
MPEPHVVESDTQCARCGSSSGWDDEAEAWRCLSSLEWCEANPLPAREDVPARWTPEHFDIYSDGTVRTFRPDLARKGSRTTDG